MAKRAAKPSPGPSPAELPAERRVRNLRAQIQAKQLEILKASLPKGKAEMAMASHRGAFAARMGQSWGRSQSWLGGTTRDRWELGSMRDRGRRVYRENAIGRSFLKVETDNVMADGFTLQMRTLTSDFNKEAESRFYPWLDSADVAQRFAASDWFRWSWLGPRKDGDGGIVLVKDGGLPRLQCIPGDLIRNPYAGFDPRTMYDGVECDLAGAPNRFHVRTLVEGTGTDTVSPVEARDFVYISHVDEPLDIRGTTVYAPIFGWLDDTDSYIDAVVKAARMAAIFGLIEKTDKPGSAVSPLLQQPNGRGDLQGAVTLENGMLKIHGSAGTVYQVQAQQPMLQTPEFIRAMTRLMCLCFDMPLEIGMRDLSQVNFSGGRIGLTGFYRSCRVKQDWIKSRVWNRIVYWWLSVERQRQKLRYPGAFKTPFPADYGVFELHGREWDYNDPLTEAQADLLEISMGIKSEQQACAERGRDWEGTQNQIADARKIKRDLKIPVVLSSVTRDEQQKVTAVDADGNPVAGQGAPLNGVQITSALQVLAQVGERTLIPDAAAILLAKLGIPDADAKAIVSYAAKVEGVTPGDRDFNRQFLLKLMDVPGARQVLYNITNIPDVAESSGLHLDKNVLTDPDQGVPLLPVVSESGPLVSGDAINDPQGDLVGGDVENDAPAVDTGSAGAKPADGGGNADKGQNQQDPAPADKQGNDGGGQQG